MSGLLSGPHGRNGLKISGDLVDNSAEMNGTDHNRRPASFRWIPPNRVGLAFAFALAHSGCAEETSELRLDERTLIGWCWRCNDLRIFAIDEKDQRKQPRPNPVSEAGVES